MQGHLAYIQSTGQLYGSNGAQIGKGFAGHDTMHIRGFNNPEAQTARGIGPLPVGIYTLGTPIDDPHLGPFAIPLIPDPRNQMFSRAGFFMHGENLKHPLLSSDGCIIQNRKTREAADADPSDQLWVFATNADYAAGRMILASAALPPAA